VYTPDDVWVGIAHGRIDGTQALAEGLYRVEGDLAILTRMGEWFPNRR
jgi:putative sterol carrier protein